MHSISRALGGLMVAALSLILLVLSAGEIYQALGLAGSELEEARKPKPKILKVVSQTLTPTTVTPTLSAFGHIESSNTLIVRARVAGEVVELSPNFTSGGQVKAGELLFAINPAKLERALKLAQIDLKDAQADVSEAGAALDLSQLEVKAAQTQLDLRRAALKRQQELQSRGLTTNADVEAAILAVSVAEQTLIGRTQLQTQNQAKLDQAQILVERREVSVAEAQSTLDDTRVFAPFDGVLANLSLTAGAIVSANEKVADLIDPSALEVPFRVTNTQFNRLLNDSGQLRKIDIEVALKTGKGETLLTAKMERSSAQVGTNQVGRLVYARITPDPAARVLPGDFVNITIPERSLSDVYQVPASAVSPNGRILLIDSDNKLVDEEVTVLRQLPDSLIISGPTAGSRYVQSRAPQLGAGVSVEVVEATTSSSALGDVTPVAEAPATIALDDARRAALIAFVEANESMQAASKEKVLAELAKPEVSLEVVEKFEAKMEAQ